jgi:hypothetical protein
LLLTQTFTKEDLMSAIVYRISQRLEALLAAVPVGTNLALYSLLWALLSGRFLLSRGALFPALVDLELDPAAVRRSAAALAYGRFAVADLLTAWQKRIEQEGRFAAHAYEGIRPVPADLVGFFRPRLVGCAGKHYDSQADKALPAVVLGLVGAVGTVGTKRLCLPRLLVRPKTGQESEKALRQETLQQAGKSLQPEEALVTDAGFPLAELLEAKLARFVGRQAQNFTARRNFLPPYRGGRPAVYGALVRPLARTYRGKTLAATPPDRVLRFREGGRTIVAHIFDNLVCSDAAPGAACFWCVVVFDPRFTTPWVLVTNLPVYSARTVWLLYRDRWPVEQVPLAGKQMLGAHQSFVFGQQSRYRLPELALLAGHLLSYVAATEPAVATGFWDRCARPTCGRLRRVLRRLHLSDLPVPGGQIRKKDSPTAHLPKGVKGHRRRKTVTDPWFGYRIAA